MTAEERFARIEHVTAGLVEQARKDREECRDLWRETQRHIEEVAAKLAQAEDQRLKFQTEVREQIFAIRAAAEERDRKTDERFKQTDERIDKLVSAMGVWISQIDERINKVVASMGELSSQTDERINKVIAAMGESTSQTDERINKLVSAMAEWISRQPAQPKS